jgi:hypothetical protein
MVQRIGLTRHSYIEETLKDNKIFDAAGLLEKNSSCQGRLKFWTNEMCAQKPQTFDIVLAVRHHTIRSGQYLTV